MSGIALVRAPFTYRYNCTDVREDVILTTLAGYLRNVGSSYEVFDFHLDRGLVADNIRQADPSSIVIAVRETADNVQYAVRLARLLSRTSRSKVILFGQTARLANCNLPPQVQVVRHDEQSLARILGIPDGGASYGERLHLEPYCDPSRLESWQQRRFRGTVETSRGCPFQCNFCFINSGENHTLRWQLQRPEVTIAAIRRYVDRGVNAFVFHDSEFFGGSRRDLARRAELIKRIRDEVPGIAFKIYARADTLAKYENYDELIEAGLVSVFIGVESLVQSDLDTLRKGIDRDLILATIRRLADLGIFMDLSFILFHRATTPATLRGNLHSLLELYSGSRARYFGMPHFTFSFESSWSTRRGHPLSGSTYVGLDVGMKFPGGEGVAFDPSLEPLMEAYRLLSYEWSRKVVELSLARDSCAAAEREAIECWFSGLGHFCAITMLELLQQYEKGRLTLTSLPAVRDWLFSRVEAYYRSLPEAMAGLATHEAHASRLDYRGRSALVEEDEYWLSQIPDPPPTSHTRHHQSP